MADVEINSPRVVKFLSRKSNSYRVVHCDGVQSITTNRGNFAMLLFSEAPDDPTPSTHEMTPEGTLGGVIEEDALAEREEIVIIREVEVGIIMRPEVAAQFVVLLQQQLNGLVSVDDTEKQEDESG